MTYRDSLNHLIAEQQRQRFNTQQEQVIQQALKDHTTTITAINDQLVSRLKSELNKINGQHVQQVVQFHKKL